MAPFNGLPQIQIQMTNTNTSRNTNVDTNFAVSFKEACHKPFTDLRLQTVDVFLDIYE